jgi:RimJ/RimL family protein N-acetyltransferase
VSADIVLRSFSEGDVPDLIDAHSDPDITQWNPGPTTTPEVVSWLENRNDWSDDRHMSWAIGSPTGRLLGSVSLFKIDLDQRDGEIGYWVAPWARRQGVGLSAVRQATDYAFSERGLHRVNLYHAIENLSSCRLATAAGYQHEGNPRSSFRYPDGIYHDEHLHGRLESD